jgi:hypothetical protein
MSELNLELSLFASFHKVDLLEAQYLRAVVEGNLMIISHYIETGVVNTEHFDEILTDPKMQAKYEQMTSLLIDGNNNEFVKLHNELLKDPAKFCGWLDHYNEILEVNTGLNLIPANRSDKLYADYLNRNTDVVDPSEE